MNTFLIILISTSFFIIIIFEIAFPFLIVKLLNKSNLKFKFLIFFVIVLFSSAILSIISAWWAYEGDNLLLNLYGFDFDAMNNFERYKNVSKDNLDRVKSLEVSIMGIGWPLKAIFGFVIYLPYQMIAYLLSYIWRKYKSRKIIE